MKTFKTLDLAIEFYDQALEIKATGNLKDQLHRAASSIALNLAEGNAKASVKEKRHFFQTAYGYLISVFEKLVEEVRRRQRLDFTRLESESPRKDQAEASFLMNFAVKPRDILGAIL